MELKGYNIVLIILILGLFGLCGAQAPWTSEETEIIYHKVRSLFTASKGSITKQMKKKGFNPKTYTKGTNFPSPAKVLRLAFHDCVPYVDGGENVNGCDGCLNNKGMETNNKKKFETDIGLKKGPDVTFTDNNGLLYIADTLELIYTDVNFPKQAPALEKSMIDSGKSRADLWAFAALVAVQYGANNNNLACQGKSPDTCGHGRKYETDCEIDLKALTSFKTGRKDCTPDSSLTRPFYTTKDEIHPNLHGNGPATVGYFKQHFGITAREAAALVEGAHSFGKVHEEVSMSIYSWTRMQEKLLNNQQFRSLVNEPMYKTVCKKKNPLFLIGDSDGEPCETDWQVQARGYSVGGGPYQWFRRYKMCPKDIHKGKDAKTYSKCLTNLDEGQQCKPECVKWHQIMETSYAADTGFYFKFESDPVTGKPSGCPGLDKEWEDGWGFNKGSKVAFPVNCELEDHAPEGEPLYAIIDDYAANQQKWFDDFVGVVHKMTANGYEVSSLTTNAFDFNSHLDH